METTRLDVCGDVKSIIAGAARECSRSLDLSRHTLNRVPEEIIRLSGFLEVLDLNDNLLGNDGAIYLAKLDRLTTLYISCNLLAASDVAPIAELRNLTTLNIANNRLGVRGAKHIANITKLTTLSIDNNELGDQGAKYLTKLKNLESLKISGNSIGYNGIRHIAKMTKLKILDLSDNQLEGTALHELSNLTNLERLHIADNPPLEADSVIALLRSLLPKSLGGTPGGSLREIGIGRTLLGFGWYKSTGVTVPPKVLEIKDPKKLLAKLEICRPDGLLRKELPDSKEMQAIAYSLKNRIASKAQIAKAIGIRPSILSDKRRWPTWREYWRRKEQAEQGGTPPDGYKTKNGSIQDYSGDDEPDDD